MTNEITEADAKRVADGIEEHWGFRPPLEYAAALALFVIETEGDPEILALSDEMDELKNGREALD